MKQIRTFNDEIEVVMVIIMFVLLTMDNRFCDEDSI